jgi:DNA transformation protein
MSLSNAYLDHVIARLSRVTEVAYRRIFNGAAIYHHGVQFALAVNDQLYFRADEMSRALFQQRGMHSLQPRGVSLQSDFFQLPNQLLDTPDELRYWVRIAVEASSADYPVEEEETSVISLPPRRARA